MGEGSNVHWEGQANREPLVQKEVDYSDRATAANMAASSAVSTAASTAAGTADWVRENQAQEVPGRRTVTRQAAVGSAIDTQQFRRISEMARWTGLS